MKKETRRKEGGKEQGSKQIKIEKKIFFYPNKRRSFWPGILRGKFFAATMRGKHGKMSLSKIPLN